MKISKFKLCWFALALCAGLGTVHAQMAQDPLLSRTTSVQPNLVFMFDDSGSMVAEYIYQYGGTEGGFGRSGPSPTTYSSKSPDVNLIYYDPRVTYSRRINSDGTFKAAGATGSIASFPVYFYKPSSSLVYTVSSVTVGAKGSGYASSGIIATFSSPPPGGTRATGTVTTTPSSNVSGVTVAARGDGYASSGVTATFSAPPAGGTTATATVTTSATLKASSVVVTSGGKDYPSSGVTATFSPAPSGGVTAAGTVTVTPGVKVSSATVTAGGSGYVASPTATFPVPPTGGTRATATVTTSPVFVPTSVTMGAQGSGYTSAPTVSFSGGGGTGAAGTATFGKAVASLTLANPGTGCSGTPFALTFSAPPAGGTIATGQVTARLSSGLGRGIASFSLTSGGSGYTSPPTVTACTGGILTATLSPTGSVTGVTLTSAGSGYTSAPTVSFSGGLGSGAAATVAGTASNTISGVTITNPGSGYASAPTLSVAGGSGATFSIGTAASNIITGVTITTPGYGYTSAPTITFGGVGSGTGATTAVSTANTYGVSAVTVTSPGVGYTSAPTLTLGSTGGGTGAAFTVGTGTTNSISAITVTNAGAGYTAPPTLALSGTGGGVGASFTVNTASTTVAIVNRKWDGTDDPVALTNYFNPSYTPDSGSPLATGSTPGLAYPNTASATTANYPKFVNRTDCGASSCTWAQEQQNYANWFTYHRTRNDIAKTGIGLAFQPLNPTFRLGWGRINTLAASPPSLDKGVRLYSTTLRDEFITWLYGAGGNGSTPNRKALDSVGKYYQRADAGGPWANTPIGDGTITVAGEEANHATCRRSYAMLMTDGYYNDSFTLADVDSTSKTVTAEPSTYVYTGLEGPFRDTIGSTTFSNTFADVAMKYWATDLRPSVGMTNDVKPTDSDPAFWQHLNFYAIGLGVIGTLDSTNPAVLAGLTGTSSSSPPRTLDWPSPQSDRQTSIDDMWHATINGRGKMLSAKTADELKNSITQMMGEVNGDPNSQSGVAVSTANLRSGTKKYTPTYTPVSWAGNVIANSLDSTTGNELAISWQIETKVTATTGEVTYNSLIPAHSSRQIFVGNGATSGVRAVPFKYDDMVTAGLTGSMTGTVTKDLINYLRSDTSNEDISALSGTALYRYRQTRLGDIVNSTPVFVKNSVDLSYEKLPTGTPGKTTYRAFVDGVSGSGGKKQRAEGLLFVGANDGMLHAFRDGTASIAGGIETFAYVPKAILPTLNQLADKAYTHRYYVDGPISETDAYFTGGTPRWANVVIGTTGAGAGVAPVAGVSSPRTAVFAFDVTALNTGPTSINASSVLWEIGSHLTDYSEMGYVLTEVQTGTTLDGSWVAIINNGYDSASCKARLYVVNLQTGARIRDLNTGVGDCTTAKNGLGGVKLVRNANQQIIGAYAGDLQGNMWKFSLNDANAANWKVDLAGSPLYAGGATQPITGTPNVIPLTSASTPQVGYMVVFGTGKFFEVADITNNTTQNVYGVWDPLAFGAVTIPSGTALTSTSLLVSQTIGAAQVGTDGNTYYNVSANTIDYVGQTTPTVIAPRRGWKIALPNTGERLVYPIQVLEGKFIVAETISPSNVSLNPCKVSGTGIGFKYLLNGLTGAGPDEAIFDTDGDGDVDSSDLIVSGFQGRADGRSVILEVTRNATDSKLVVIGAEKLTKAITLSCKLRGDCVTPANTPRVKSRQWRQLFMR